MLNELCGCCLRQWISTVSFWRATLCPSISLDCLGISMETPWPTTQLNVTHFHHWKPCLATNNGHFRHCILQLVEVLTRVTLLDSRKFLMYKVSIMLTKCPWFHLSLPNSVFHSLSHLPNTPFPIITQPKTNYKCILFPLLREIHAPPDYITLYPTSLGLWVVA